MVTSRKITVETLDQTGRTQACRIADRGGGRKPAAKANPKLGCFTKDGPEALGAILRRRLVTLSKSRSMLSYDRVSELIAELDELRKTIIETIGTKNSKLAFELLWKFLDLHSSILGSVDDSSGRVGSIFRMACEDLGPIAQRARIEPEALAATVFEKVISNRYGIYDGLGVSLAAALGQKGRAALQGLLLQRRQQYLTEDKRAVTSAGRYDFTLGCLSVALRDIAKCEGDADAFIDTYQDSNLTNPLFASEIALQLLRAGRGQEALGYLDRAAPSAANPHFGQIEWTDAKIATLDAVQRVEEAQTLRLAFFQDQLSPSHLRAYLHRLPDFDDVEAEDRALDFVAGHNNVHAALAFLVWWPALEQAAQLVRSRISEIDGDLYELLDPAAIALEGKYPLAAVCSAGR